MVTGVVDCPIHDGLDGCDVVIVEVSLVLLALHIVLVVVLLSPPEPNEIDGRELNTTLVEELHTWERMSVHRLLSVENATHLFTNNTPQKISVALPSEFMTHWSSNKLHEAPIGLRPRGRDEFFSFDLL